MKQQNLYLRIKNKMKEATDIIDYLKIKTTAGDECNKCEEDIDLLLVSSLEDIKLINDDFTLSAALSHIIPVFLVLNRIDEAKNLYTKITIHFIRNELEDAYSILR
jgi:hypothetical protein